MRVTLAGCLLLGAACGLLGAFLLVRRLSLTGDVLSHAVLPGVVLGFWWHSGKDPLALVLGASATAALAMATLRLLQGTTRLKEDALLGLVLAGFYAAGVFLMSLVQRTQEGSQAGLESFLLGQAAAMTGEDVAAVGIITGGSLLFVALFFKELVASAFDRSFCRTAGIPVAWLDRIFIALLTFAIVAAVQAVGVVLVSALLVTPAATGYLLTRRMLPLILLAVGFGMVSAGSGAFISSLDSGLPTGPFIVLSAALLFGIALLAAPERGLIPKYLKHRADSRRILIENNLKAIFRHLETGGDASAGVELTKLGPLCGSDGEKGEPVAARLIAAGLATRDSGAQRLLLTPEGWHRASSVVRNHRLWELYLTHAAEVPADHVHDDAEDMEHFLDEETVRKLERRLEFARSDPHGRAIPNIDVVNQAASAPPFRANSGNLP